jgi:hypothetical protein
MTVMMITQTSLRARTFSTAMGLAIDLNQDNEYAHRNPERLLRVAQL